jgi:hypothetical protein
VRSRIEYTYRLHSPPLPGDDGSPLSITEPGKSRLMIGYDGPVPSSETLLMWVDGAWQTHGVVSWQSIRPARPIESWL